MSHGERPPRWELDDLLYRQPDGMGDGSFEIGNRDLIVLDCLSLVVGPTGKESSHRSKLPAHHTSHAQRAQQRQARPRSGRQRDNSNATEAVKGVAAPDATATIS